MNQKNDIVYYTHSNNNFGNSSNLKYKFRINGNPYIIPHQKNKFPNFVPLILLVQSITGIYIIINIIIIGVIYFKLTANVYSCKTAENINVAN